MWSITGAVFSLWLTKADSLNLRGLNIHLIQAFKEFDLKILAAEITVGATDPSSQKLKRENMS